ncbi:hypothetical protein C3495_05945 [Clostridiaceae bacterium 14S0207]|nr:hypothetical protein C3495_05945 [Clostridiaceae bacterium 14S0207]
MITRQGIDLIANSILNLIDHGEIVIGKEVKKLALYKTSIENNYMKVFLMLDDTMQGEITETKLISKSDEVLMNKADIIQKDTSRGLLIIFSLKIQEVEG